VSRRRRIHRSRTPMRAPMPRCRSAARADGSRHKHKLLPQPPRRRSVSVAMRWHAAAALAVTIAMAVVVHVIPVPRDHPHGRGPAPACELPPRSCTGEHCGDLVEIPVAGPGYVDVQLAGEDTAETSTSYLRRDVMMLVRYATAKVACKTAAWRTGNGG